ncbi:17673_t:CDS:2, partial [Gigaspora rosea]
VYTWSSTRFIYNICNNTYANDLFHIDEKTGVFHTDSPYVQEVTYIGKGARNFPTQMYLINLDGCTDDCNIMFNAEVGQNFSLTSPGRYYCKASSSYQPFAVNVTSVNIYSGVSPNIKYNVPPSMVLHYCKLGINIDDNILDLAREATEPEKHDSKPEEWLNLANQSITNYSYIELNKALIYQSRIPTEFKTQQPYSQISGDIQNLIDLLQRNYFSSGNTDGSMFPTMRFTAAVVEESDSGELTSGARFNPIAARRPWKRSKKDAMKDFQKNADNSSLTLDDLKSQLDNITSSIHTEFKNSIASNLVEETCTTEDIGRSIMAKFTYWCNCNPPIGNGSCTFTGGFGPNNDGSYDGYRKEQLDLIHQWRDVSDICQNVNGGYKRTTGVGGNKRSTRYLSCRATDDP